MIKQETLASILLFIFASFISAPLITSVSGLDDQISIFEIMTEEEENIKPFGKEMADTELNTSLNTGINDCLEKEEQYIFQFMYSYMHLEDIFQPPKYSC